WFWWFGEDHYTSDKAVFDDLFRGHLRAAYRQAGLETPASLEVPIAARRSGANLAVEPIGFVHPVVDGRRTHFYEWHAAGRMSLGAGGMAMHRGVGIGRELRYGFDEECFYLRVDFVTEGPPDPPVDLRLELIEPRTQHLEVSRLARGV